MKFKFMFVEFILQLVLDISEFIQHEKHTKILHTFKRTCTADNKASPKEIWKRNKTTVLRKRNKTCWLYYD